jgi:pilus assembly protein CpaE
MAEKILIVDDDLDTLRLVGLMLQRQGYQISAANNGEQGLEKALQERPDLILLDLMMPGMDGYEVARRLRSNPTTTTIPILMFTAKTQLDDKVVGFEAGADDYLTKPTHPSELQAHVRALLARATKASEEQLETPSNEQHGYMIAVLSARGGLGVSSVAVNLAAALFARTQADVILAEMVPGQGTLGVDLGIIDGKILNGILSGAPVEITREKVESALVTHRSGVKFMPASENPRDIQLTARVQNYEMLLTRLSALARFVVLDMASGLPPFVLGTLPLSNELVLVVEGQPNAIHHARLMIDQMGSLGIEPRRISAVLNNRFRSETQMPSAKVQELLGHPIALTIAPAPELFLQASRMQTPAVICQPENIASQQFIKLADQILEREKAR